MDDVLVDVCGHELHLDGPVAPGRLLRPVLHTELGQERGQREKEREAEGGVGAVGLISQALSYCLQNMLARKEQ